MKQYSNRIISDFIVWIELFDNYSFNHIIVPLSTIVMIMECVIKNRYFPYKKQNVNNISTVIRMK
jgi:hypothetical protein